MKGLGFRLVKNRPNSQKIDKYPLLPNCIPKKLNLIFVKFVFI